MHAIKYRTSFFLSVTLFLVVIFSFRPSYFNFCTAYCVYPVLFVYKKSMSFYKKNAGMYDEHAFLEQRISQLTRERDSARAHAAVAWALHALVSKTKHLDFFKKRYGYHKARTVCILYRCLTDNENYMFVDAGSASGIQKGMIAVAGDILLGRVVSVYPWYSKVVLVTDASCKVAAYIPRTCVHGVHEGCNSPESALIHVGCLEDVHENDMVMSSGYGTVFPPGFVIGSITSCAKESLFYAITVRPFAVSYDGDYCLILPYCGSDSLVPGA